MGDDQFEFDLHALRAAADELPVDDVVRVLGDRCARSVLVYLHDNPTPTLEKLADVVTAKAASETETIATSSDRDRVRLRLYHATLPRLEELGFLAFDTETKTVTETDIPDAVSDALGVTDTKS